ncbi:Est1 DNA/RNA binding domain [Popillia japonica]|uniref:Est1 DNA/RNA binding domain n=1 Tax=Popillia japonica TaxID=7064 RepID=A0AAW1L6L3_POPJA
MMRKAVSTDPSNKEQYKGFLLYLIDEGVKYFEMLLDRLEEVYSFKIADYLGYSNTPTKGKFVGLVLISIQKIFLYLGDLLRYKEQVNETSNYGKCRQWYVKAHEINPKNGKPYNQLALLAVYARRKLDAVYYYMRSLMSSNPAPSAKESLNSLFDENRKKVNKRFVTSYLHVHGKLITKIGMERMVSQIRARSES